jgi:uncharacterized RDD family membrane protein YckC
MSEEVQSYYATWRRFFALLIDGFFVSFFLYSLILTMRPLGSSFTEVLSLVISIEIVTLALILFYFIWTTGKFGQTLGKLVMGIKVVDVETEQHPIGYRRAFYRMIPFVILGAAEVICFLFIDADITFKSLRVTLSGIRRIFLIIGILWALVELVIMLTHSRRQSLHDRMAGSVVVKQLKKFKPEELPA